MNKAELKAERVRQGKDIQYMADLIGKAYSVYRNKEASISRFTADEIATIANDLQLTLPRVNEIFFDGKLTSWQKA